MTPEEQAAIVKEFREQKAAKRAEKAARRAKREQRMATIRAGLIAGDAMHLAEVSPILIELRGQGMPSREIAKTLNERGIPSSQYPLRGPWTRYLVDQTINKIDGTE